MATRSKVREAARSQSTRSGRAPQSAIDKQLKAFGDKDLRPRSVGKDVRKCEAKRHLMDIGLDASRPDNQVVIYVDLLPTALLQNNVASDRTTTRNRT